VEGILMGIED